MNAKPTRRTVGKLLLAAPLAVSLAEIAEAAAAISLSSPTRAMSPKEKKLLAKSVAELRKSLGKLAQVEVPIGTEPAFVFRPLLPPGLRDQGSGVGEKVPVPGPRPPAPDPNQ